MIASFLDISSEADQQGLFDANQHRLMSLAGLLVHNEPGQLLRSMDSRSTTTAIGFAGNHVSGSEDGVPVWPASPSKITTISTGSNVGEADVMKLRDLLITVQQLAVEVVEARLKVAYARALAVAKLEDGADTEEQADALDGSQAVTNAEADHTKKRDEFNKALTKAKQAIDKPGLVVTRWTTKTQSDAGLSLGDILGIRGSTENLTSGFAIFGGLRTSQIALGQDYKKLKSYIDGGFSLMLRPPFFRLEPDNEDVRLVTYTIETKCVAYVQDVSSSTSLGLRLKASYQQLKNLGKTLQEIDKIEIAAAFAKVQDLSNMALLGGVAREDFAAPWAAKPDATSRLSSFSKLEKSYGKREKDETSTDEEGWRILYAVDVDMEDLQWHFR